MATKNLDTGAGDELRPDYDFAFETNRLRLRPYVQADEAALFEVFHDADARMYYPQMSDRAKVRKWIEWNLRNYDEYGFGLWAVELRASGGLIGDCGLTYQEVDGGRELEIGYHLVRSERGKGYATEAARVCIDVGFERTTCDQVCSIVNPANEASCRVAARIHADSRACLSYGRPARVFFTSRLVWRRATDA